MTDQADIPESEMDKALFVNLIMMLSTSSLQYLGAMPDPTTGKADINLEAAQAYIDLLDMLFKKTNGNLDAEESKMLTESLSSLKLAYVQAADNAAGPSQPAPTPTQEEPAASTEAPQQQSPEEPIISTDPTPEEKSPKFHKKYD